jgi:hypothetical protein
MTFVLGIRKVSYGRSWTVGLGRVQRRVGGDIYRLMASKRWQQSAYPEQGGQGPKGHPRKFLNCETSVEMGLCTAILMAFWLGGHFGSHEPNNARLSCIVEGDVDPCVARRA